MNDDVISDAETIDTDQPAAEGIPADPPETTFPEIERNDTPDDLPEMTDSHLESLSLPDEFAAQNDQLDAFRDLARELNLPRDSAQALVDFELQRIGQIQRHQEARWQETMADWLKSARSDAEIGGTAFDSKVADARMAFNTFGDEDLMRLVSPPSESNPDGLGIGNHPALLRFCYRISQQISPDRFIPSNQQSGGMKSAAEILYPTKE